MKGRHTWIRTAWAALWIAAGITVTGIGASAETVQESTEVMESETLLTEGESFTEEESLTEESSITEEREIPYIHDPRDNPKAMKDIVYDPAAVYCFAPDPNSTRIGIYAEDDWTDPEAVEARRKERIAYHESISELYQIIDDMLHQAKRLEEIARAVSQRRNELRLEAVKNNPDELARTKQSNLDAYGHEEGPTPDELYEKYGSWQTVLEKAMGTNQGVDACVGLYDEYYDYYDIEDQVMETAAPEASAAGTEAAGTSVMENASQAVQSADAVQSAEAVQSADEAETIPYWTEDSEDGKDYTLSPEDKVVYSGEVIVKNQKMNKVTSIITEIGKTPVLVFGNSSGDLAMGQYAVSNEKYEGKAYMLLCDDTERDYGKTDVAQSFAEKCDSLGFTTVSMKNDFDTIYGYDVTKADAEMEEVQEEVQTEMQEENAA